MRAKALGVSAPPEVVKQAAIAAIAGDLRHTDPDRRARGRKRLLLVEPRWAAALAGDGDPVVIGTVAEWLESVRAYRTMREMLDERVRLHGVESLRDAPGAANRWLLARRWWGGAEARPDLVTLDKAEAIGADRAGSRAPAARATSSPPAAPRTTTARPGSRGSSRTGSATACARPPPTRPPRG